MKMNQKRKIRNSLIICALISFILAPFATHFLTPVLVKWYCYANPEFLCGIGLAPVYAAAIFVGFLFLGLILIAIATGIVVKEKKSARNFKK